MTAAEFKKSAGSVFDSTLGGSAASIDVTGISNTYAHLMMTIYARSDTAAAAANMFLQFNGDTGANYDYQDLSGNAASPAAVESFGLASGAYVGNCPANTAGANLFGSSQVFIPNYANSSNNKQAICFASNKVGTTSASIAVHLIGPAWRSNAAINRITLVTTGNFVAGSRFTIHALGA